MISKKVVRKAAPKTVAKGKKSEPKLQRIRILTATGRNRLEKAVKPAKKKR